MYWNIVFPTAIRGFGGIDSHLLLQGWLHSLRPGHHLANAISNTSSSLKSVYWGKKMFTGMILCMHLANESWCYNVTSSLIGWAHSQNYPCVWSDFRLFILLLWVWSIYGYSFLTANHYNDVIVGTLASQITSLTIVFSTIYLDTNQRKHQNSESLAFVQGIHRRPVNSPHKWPVMRKMFPYDDIIMVEAILLANSPLRRPVMWEDAVMRLPCHVWGNFQPFSLAVVSVRSHTYNRPGHFRTTSCTSSTANPTSILTPLLQ